MSMQYQSSSTIACCIALTWPSTFAKALLEGEVRIWNNSSLEAAIARARTRVFRALTPAERSEYGLRKLD